jgi:small subunit ribosomal protein S16
MLSIRLSRTGKKHQPSYRLIVVDRRRDPWGDYLENLGFYNPLVKPKVAQFKADRVKYWLSVGAKATPTVWNLLVDQKIVEGKKMKATTGHTKLAAERAPEEKPSA